MKLNSHGTNATIQAHILPENEMRLLGFTDHVPDKWYYCKCLPDETTFNVTIPKDGSDISIEVIDDDFCQPYDYQTILRDSPRDEFALKIKELVEQEMKRFQKAGVLSGHNYGDYI